MLISNVFGFRRGYDSLKKAASFSMKICHLQIRLQAEAFPAVYTHLLLFSVSLAFFERIFEICLSYCGAVFD